MSVLGNCQRGFENCHEMYWYAVNTKPHQENLAALNLHRLGLETFCPKVKQEKVFQGKRQTVIGPLFPGYLFVRFRLDAHQRAVAYAQGVRKLVAFGSVPETVPDEIIESIRSRLQDGYVTVQPCAFAHGQAVQIREGPLRGLEAIFEEEMSGHQRAVLLLRELSYQARVVVDIANVVNL